MKFILFSFLFITLHTFSFGQANYAFTDAERDYKQAKELFIKEQYALAYPLLKELKQQYPENTQSSHTNIFQDVQYYYIVTGLKLDQPIAETEATRFIVVANNEARQQIMSYHLARYYFMKNDFTNAVTYYERAKFDNLSNEEIADAKFELAYSYFSMKNFEKAKPLFKEIQQLPDNKYFYSSNYYYGFITYNEGDYAEALKSFKATQQQVEYKNVVPYYIAEILYAQGSRDEALRYGEAALSSGDVFKKKELGLLVGQIYFEKRMFAKALPYLENYVNNTDRVSKEVMYELSYSYYDANNVDKAIEGFRQLSNGTDSLAQNSMYLLGDLYLRTGQKVNARNAFQFSANNSSNRRQQEISKFNYAKLSYELGYEDIAITQMRKFTDLYPGSVYANEAKEILVALLAKSNNFNDALALYQSIERPTSAMQKVYPRILYGKASEFLSDQNLNKADELFMKVINDPNAGPLFYFSHFWRGEIAYRQGRYEEAIIHMNGYLKSSSSQGEATPQAAGYVLGYSFLNKEDYRRAINYFELVSRSVSTQSSAMEQDAYIRTADIYFMSRDYAKARAMYDNVQTIGLPQSDYALYQKGMIAGINNLTDKIRLLNSLISQYPNSDLFPDANLEIANTYMAQERFRDALPFLSKIISGTSSLRAAAFLKSGLAYYNLDNNSEALVNYQKLLSLYPQSSEADDALENMKAIYVEEGRPNEYLEIVRKAGKNISVSEADKLTYSAAQLKYTNGDCAGAIAAFTNYLSQFPDGAFVAESNYFRSECYNKIKDWRNAASGYEAVISHGGKFAERSALQAAKIYYVELQDYNKAKLYFLKLREIATTQVNQLEALRGIVRSYYQTKDFTEANKIAKELLLNKGISSDDKAIANLVSGKSLQQNNQCDQAITAFKAVAAVNKSAWGAEARYEIADCYLKNNNLTAAEKAAMEVIKVTGSYDFWVAKAYLLIGDVYMAQKDYFNARATYQSVAANATIPEIKTEAQQKLDKAIAAENSNSRVQ
ncbi:tetratricopeptide repeat protein [soil metagenome]